MTLPRYSTPIPSSAIAINSFVKPCSAKTMWQTCHGMLNAKRCDKSTCLCVKWIINQVEFTGKLLVVFSLQVQRVFVGTESVVWGKCCWKIFKGEEEMLHSRLCEMSSCHGLLSSTIVATLSSSTTV